MNNLFIIFIILPFSIYGQDTISIDGGYEIGKFNKNRDKVGCWITYDNERITEKKVYKNSGKETYKILKYDYKDSSITSGIRKPYRGKSGKYKVYHFSGELLKIERYKFNKKHGIQRNLVANSKDRYYLGYHKSDLYNKEGKRYVFYYTVGLPKFRGNKNCSEELFACKRLPIAGCVVSTRILRRQAVHNFFVNLKQVFRYGFDWKKEYYNDKTCVNNKNITTVPKELLAKAYLKEQDFAPVL